MSQWFHSITTSVLIRPQCEMGGKRSKRNRGRQGNKPGGKQASSKPSKGVYGLANANDGIKDTMTVYMPYGAAFSLSIAAGSAATYSWRGNSVYDPDYTGIGISAYHYAKFSLMYNRYRVTSSALEVSTMVTGTGAVTAYLIATIANAPPGLNQLLASKHVAYAQLCPGGPATWKHKAGMPTNVVFGVPMVQVRSEDDFAGLVGGNPNNVWYWHMYFVNNTAVATTVEIYMRILYKTLWSMPLSVSA